MENKTIIGIIPCYNEEKRLKVTEFLENIPQHPCLKIIFVDDGSRDKTREVLANICSQIPHQAQLLSLSQNAGKANAVYQGIQKALSTTSEYIGYLDADLAVSIDEFMRVATVAMQEEKRFVFGARWRRLDSDINRKLHRHLLGRVYATLASNVLDLPVYDTQCSAKVIESQLAKEIFNQPFQTNWSFDVELFFRIKKILGKKEMIRISREVPLDRWVDVEGSKVTWKAGLKAFVDLLKLKKHYR